MISELVLVKPRVGEKGWGTGLMHTHQFLNSFFMFPGIKTHAAWLIWESHNIPQSLLPHCGYSCVARAVSLEISNLIKVKCCKEGAWWPLQTAATGIIFPDCLPSPFSTASVCTPLLSMPFRAVIPSALLAHWLPPLISNVSPHNLSPTLQHHSSVADTPCKYSQNSL